MAKKRLLEEHQVEKLLRNGHTYADIAKMERNYMTRKEYLVEQSEPVGIAGGYNPQAQIDAVNKWMGSKKEPSMWDKIKDYAVPDFIATPDQVDQGIDWIGDKAQGAMNWFGGDERKHTEMAPSEGPEKLIHSWDTIPSPYKPVPGIQPENMPDLRRMLGPELGFEAGKTMNIEGRLPENQVTELLENGYSYKDIALYEQDWIKKIGSKLSKGVKKVGKGIQKFVGGANKADFSDRTPWSKNESRFHTGVYDFLSEQDQPDYTDTTKYKTVRKGRTGGIVQDLATQKYYSPTFGHEMVSDTTSNPFNPELKTVNWTQAPKPTVPTTPTVPTPKQESNFNDMYNSLIELNQDESPANPGTGQYELQPGDDNLRENGWLPLILPHGDLQDDEEGMDENKADGYKDPAYRATIKQFKGKRASKQEFAQALAMHHDSMDGKR